MFFGESRRHFFRPLIGKYREQVVACLRALYGRLYSSQADYSRAFTRDQVLELFQEATARTPVLEEGEEDAGIPAARGTREQANWVLNLLLEHGWLEKNVDEATLHSTYAFSRTGRLFTQPLVEMAGGRFRTRHRNTRNTRNALHSFLEKGEVYDLLDAYEYSERIVADFSDIIAELDERKRQLVRDVEAQQIVQRATDEFFDFMEKRFMPDLAIRLSADSVEKYRDEIGDLLRRARRQRKEFKTRAEQELRRAAPELLGDRRSSLYLALLDGIDARVHSASEVMLPALRQALHGFTRRADIIIRQLTFTGAARTRLLAICQGLSALPEAEADARLTAAGAALASLNVGFVDPDAIRLHSGSRRRVVNTAVERPEGDPKARRALFVAQALERAFAVSQQAVRDYVIDTLAGGHRLSTANLPVRSARELLYCAHVIGIGEAGSGPYRFHVEPTGQRVRSDYFEAMDEFTIELVETAPC